MISSLKDNEVFVFGSNSAGKHLGGAAKQAFEQFGAKWGLGEGLYGQTYAFPTLTENFEKRTNRALKWSAYRLKLEASHHPDKKFLLTKVGCGIAGYPEEEMKELFSEVPDNIVKPKGW